jgi:hypothetical protein
MHLWQRETRKTIGVVMMKNPVIDTNGNKRWYDDNSKLHRVDGPALEYANGDKYWCINGELHRVDGPALEYIDGTKAWYLNGQCHCADGPAIEYTDGETRYFINDKYIPQLNNKRIYGKEKLERLLLLV